MSCPLGNQGDGKTASAANSPRPQLPTSVQKAASVREYMRACWEGLLLTIVWSDSESSEDRRNTFLLEMELKSEDYSPVATDEEQSAKTERSWSWKGRTCYFFYLFNLRFWTSPQTAYSRLASLCRLVVGEDDEQDVGQLHLQHPLHRWAPLWTQHKVDEHGEKVVFERILRLLF